jgi:hypothetical protein
MKRLSWSVVLVSVVSLGLGGCAGLNHRPSVHVAAATPRTPTYALAVTVDGALQPTAAQWAAIRAEYARSLAAIGAVLVTDLALADYILRIDFKPDPADPENRGHATLLNVRRNPASSAAILAGGIAYEPTPRRTVARSAYSSFAGFAGFAGGFGSAVWPSPWNFGGLYSGNYGYWDARNSGYTGGGGGAVVTPSPPTPQPPKHHHRPPGERVDCPPDLAPRPPLAFARTDRPAWRDELHRRYPPSGDSTASRSSGYSGAAATAANPSRLERWFGRSAAGSDRTTTRSDRTERSAYRSESGYARRDYSGSSRSESGRSSDTYSSPAPVYNSPAPSFSDSSSSSGSLSFPSSSGYSAPSHAAEASAPPASQSPN